MLKAFTAIIILYRTNFVNNNSERVLFMDLSNFSQYLNLIVSGTCLCVGILIKNSLDFIPNKYIPLIAGTLGVFLNIWFNEWRVTPEIIFGGLLSGLSSTGIFEVLKNTTDLV